MIIEACPVCGGEIHDALADCDEITNAACVDCPHCDAEITADVDFDPHFYNIRATPSTGSAISNTDGGD